MNHQERLLKAIPGGAHTYSRGFDQFPANAPQILERGKGAYVWDTDGNKFLDYGMALRAVTLGYADPEVNAAAIREIEKGNSMTRASTVELEAAELLIDLIPAAEMVKFAKNGSNATTAAVKLARAYNRRRYVCVPRQHPFFSFDDWFIGTTPMQRGIPDSNVGSTLIFDYNDIASLEKLFADHPGEIAAVMLEPATTMVPCTPGCGKPLTHEPPCRLPTCTNPQANFLWRVQSLCKAEGAVFILDEMITGFRWNLKGAAHYFDVVPDLVTFGKGMANGFSLAAVAGKREIMDVGSITPKGSERTFLLSSTHGGEMSPLGAFIETTRIYKEKNVVRGLWEYGSRLKKTLLDAAASSGLKDHFTVDGPDININYVTRDDRGEVSLAFRTLFHQEMIKGGVMMPWLAVSFAHGDAELEWTRLAAEKAMSVYRQALDQGIEKFLVGEPVKPVFRKFN